MKSAGADCGVSFTRWFRLGLLCAMMPMAGLRGQTDAVSGPQQNLAAGQVAGGQARAARLTFLAGAVQVQRVDNTGEDTALLNMPLAEGTRLVTGDYGQAEVEFEDGSVVRVTPRSSVVLTTLSLDNRSVAHTRVTLLGGLAYFELRKAATAEYTVEAGGTVASPEENVTLRVNLDEPPAVFAVLAGAVRVQRAEAYQTVVRMGESLRADGSDDSRYFLQQEIAAESWDQWNLSRDQAAAGESDGRTAARDGYAGAQGYGWSDLDASGTWYDVPGHGQVWQPAEATVDGGADSGGFDPYANGAWVWGGGGYVYASAYTWGWTPYRCGSWWFYPGFGWAWTPDPACSRWGFGGYGGGDVFFYNAGGGPPRRIPIPRPNPPRGPHPTLPVRAPNGVHLPRPRPLDAPVKIAGVTARPLQPVGGMMLRREGPANQALRRDFPVDAKTRTPVLGVPAGTSAMQRPAMPNREGPGTGGPLMTPTQSEQVGRGTQRPAEGGAKGSAPYVPPARTPAGVGSSQPAYRPIEPQQAPRNQAPAAQQPVYRPAPQPAAPPPAYHPAPPPLPPAAAPAPAPAHVDAPRAKG